MASILFKLLTVSVFLALASAEKQWCKLNSTVQNECNRCWCIGHGVPVCTKMDCKRIPPEHWEDILARSKQLNNEKDNSKKDNETKEVGRKTVNRHGRGFSSYYGRDATGLSAWGGTNIFSRVVSYLGNMFSGNTGRNSYYYKARPGYGPTGYNPNGFGYPGNRGYGANGYGTNYNPNGYYRPGTVYCDDNC